MDIEIGSTWEHREGKRASVVSADEYGVEIDGCGRWPIAEFDAQWHRFECRVLASDESHWDHVESSREIATLQAVLAERDATIAHLRDVIRGFADDLRKRR